MSAQPPLDDVPEQLYRQYDGAERIPFLAAARLVLLSAAANEEDPVSVLIQWTADSFERPAPGSALWRAVLDGRLAMPPGDDPGEGLLRKQIEISLRRWPDLETWWRWLRSGWTAPPRPGRWPPADPSRGRPR